MWAWLYEQLSMADLLPPTVTPDAVRLRFQKLQRQQGILGPRSHVRLTPDPPPPADEPAHQHAGPAPLSELDMIALFRVDTMRWEVVGLEHRTYAAGAKGPDGELVTSPLYITRLRCRRIAGAETLDALGKDLLADIAAVGAQRPRVKPRVSPTADHLLEIAPMDLHIGKLSWPEETGQAYDIAHAESAFVAAIEDLLAKTSTVPVEEIIIPIGNDLLHVDNLENTTTSGTRMDADSRYHKMFRKAHALMAWAAERCVERAPVKLIVVPGNHDRLGAFHVGEVLAAQFSDHRFIDVQNGPALRKYHHYGTTLLGFTHGSEEKHADLPLIMAQEQSDQWAQSTCREWHLGHFHKRKEMRFTAGDSFAGVVVRVLPSLSAADAWHAAKGFIGQRRAVEAYVFHKTDGYVGHFQSRVVPEATP